MPARIPTAALVLALFLPAGAALAQPSSSYFTLEPTSGFPLLRGSLRFADLRLDHGTCVGGRIGYQWNERFGFEAGADRGSIRQWESAAVDSASRAGGASGEQCPSCITGDGDATFVRGSADLRFAPYAAGRGSVYAVAGAGASRLRSQGGGERIDQTHLELGYGVRFWFTDAVAFGLEARHLFRVFGDGRSSWGSPSTLVGAGITVARGRSGSRASVEPVSVDPAHVDPAHVDPAHVDPAHVDPAHVDPAHVDPAHVDPALVQPVPHHDLPDSCAVAIVRLNAELIERGRIVLHGFDAGRAEVPPAVKRQLASIGCWLESHPEYKLVELGGYTELRGWQAYDLRLSQDRADSVLSALRREVPALHEQKFVARGYGSEHPVAPNDTEENRAKNRRIEFRVLSRDPAEP